MELNASEQALGGGELNFTDIHPAFAIPEAISSVEIVFETLFGLLLLSGTVLNLILVLVFLRRRGFRSQTSNRFLMNLVFSNLMSCVLFIPFVLYDTSTSQTSAFDEAELDALCPAATTVALFTTTGSILAQLLIGVDQFLAVTDPLQYHRRISKTRCLILCLSSWFLACVFTAASLLNPSDWSYGSDGIPLPLHVCMLQREQGSASYVYVELFVIVAFLLPFLLLSFVYSRIFCAARQNSVKTRRNSVCSATFEACSSASNTNLNQLQYNYQYHQNNNNYSNNNNNKLSPYYAYNKLQPKKSGSNPPSKPCSRSSSTASNLAVLTNNIRRKLSNASAFLAYREESRAAKVTMLVLMMIFLCWAPFFCCSLIIAFDKSLPVALPGVFRMASLVMVCASPTLTPLLYAYRSRRVQRDIRRVLGVSRRRHASNGMSAATKALQSVRQRKLAKMQRMKSFSCPQLLISSVVEDKGGKTVQNMMLPTGNNPCSLLHKQVSGLKLIPASLPTKRRRLGVVRGPDNNFLCPNELPRPAQLTVPESAPMLSAAAAAVAGSPIAAPDTHVFHDLTSSSFEEESISDVLAMEMDVHL